jgi:hypothetical protein
VEKVSASHIAAALASNVLQASFRLGMVGNSVHRARSGSRAKILGHSSGKNRSRVVKTRAKAAVSFVRVPRQVERVSASRTAAAPVSSGLPPSFLHGTVGNSVHHARNGSRAKILGHPSVRNGSHAVKLQARDVASFAHAAVQSPRNAVHSSQDPLLAVHFVRDGKRAVFPASQNQQVRNAPSRSDLLRIERAQTARNRRRESVDQEVRAA